MRIISKYYGFLIPVTFVFWFLWMSHPSPLFAILTYAPLLVYYFMLSQGKSLLFVSFLAVICVGLVSNCLVVSTNGGYMPVLYTDARIVSIMPGRIAVSQLPDPKFLLLCDRISIADLFIASIGDLFIFSGIFLYTISAINEMRGKISAQI